MCVPRREAERGGTGHHGKAGDQGRDSAHHEGVSRVAVWDETDARAVADAVREGVWGIHGRRIQEFAEAFAPVSAPEARDSGCQRLVRAGSRGGGRRCEAPVMRSSCRTTPSWPPRSRPCAAGRSRVLVDVDPVTCNMDPQKMTDAISSRTRAIIVVHIGGPSLRHDLDHGDRREVWHPRSSRTARTPTALSGTGRPLDHSASICTFSFQSSKTLAIGEGGLVATNSDQTGAAAVVASQLRPGPAKPDYNHYVAATNCRMGNSPGRTGREPARAAGGAVHNPRRQRQVPDGAAVPDRGHRPQGVQAG